MVIVFVWVVVVDFFIGIVFVLVIVGVFFVGFLGGFVRRILIVIRVGVILIKGFVVIVWMGVVVRCKRIVWLSFVLIWGMGCCIMGSSVVRMCASRIWIFSSFVSFLGVVMIINVRFNV